MVGLVAGMGGRGGDMRGGEDAGVGRCRGVWSDAGGFPQGVLRCDGSKQSSRGWWCLQRRA